MLLHCGHRQRANVSLENARTFECTLAASAELVGVSRSQTMQGYLGTANGNVTPEARSRPSCGNYPRPPVTESNKIFRKSSSGSDIRSPGPGSAHVSYRSRTQRTKT